MGVSRKLINELESCERPIDLRTALAARQLYNERARLFSSHAVIERAEDVPLEEAMILWDCDTPGKPPVIVVSHPEGNDDDYSSSAGSCSIDWQTADNIGRLLRLFGCFTMLTVQDGYDPMDVHKAFSVIPEYRYALSVDMFDGTEVE